MAGAFTLLALYDFVCEVAPPFPHAPLPVPDVLSLFAARARGLNGAAAALPPPPVPYVPGAD